MPQISIKTSILTIFLILVSIVAFSLLFSQYYFSEKMAMKSTTKAFSMIYKNISGHLYKEAENNNHILIAKSNHIDILEPITFNPFHPVLQSFIQILQIKNNIHSIYMGHLDGHFYEVVNIQNREILAKSMGAPAQSCWAVVTIIDDRVQNAFLDEKFQLISKKTSSLKYNLFNRPWYKKAIASDSVIGTMPYLFAETKLMGITFAKRLEKGGGVIALDHTLEQLNSILALQKYDEKSEIFMVDFHGKKYASSSFKNAGAKKVLDSRFKKALEAKEIGTILHYREGDDEYFAMLAPLDANDDYLGIKIDANKLLKPHRDNIKYAMYIALILLFVSLPIVLLSTRLIIKPIQKLIVENEKIKHRNFSEVKEISSNIIEFQELSYSLASMSESIQAYQKSQEEMLDSIIKLIAEAIDAKSPYTGGHCERVPKIAQMLLDEANNSQEGIFEAFSLTSKDALREFEIGSWLHDCGKVTTPEYVVDKSTKLETIYNRIHEVRMRFEVLWRDAQLEYMHTQLMGEDKESALEALHIRQKQLVDDYNFIASVNIGGEFMDEAKKARVKEIASQEWERHFNDRIGLSEIENLRYKNEPMHELPAIEKLLDDKSFHIVERDNFDYEKYEKEGFKEEVPEYLYNYGEVYNLCIGKGTLTPEERYKINEHVIMSIKMLEKIPFPSQLKNIPEYAGTHHETLNGAGYPRKLTKNELSIPARIMAIADIFEALTASNRPYKQAKTLSESIKIMSFMVKDQHIDADLFKLFLSSGIYKVYAKEYLKDEQIDEVDIANYYC